MSQNSQNLPDIDQGLDNLTEETTAGDLVRKQGQNKKLRTIREKDLRRWIDEEIRRRLVGKEDAFTDAQKIEISEQLKIKLQEANDQIQDSRRARKTI